MSVPRGRINPEKVSLIGGVVVGIASMILWVAVTRELGFGGTATLAIGLVVSAAVATWVRLADL
jgi:hypothetical protein